MACVLVTCAIGVSACVAPSTPSDDARVAAPYTVPDDATIVRVAFTDVTTEHCLGSYLLDKGAVQTTPCDTPGASTIVAVTTFGDHSPGGTPDEVGISRAAADVCAPEAEAWLDAHGLPSSTPQVHVMPDEWDGAGTPLICAVWTGP